MSTGPSVIAGSFSGKCLTCYTMKDCGVFPKIGDKISGGCVDCHMPLLQSKAIVSDLNGKRIAARVRTHWIKVYSEEGEVTRLENRVPGK